MDSSTTYACVFQCSHRKVFKGRRQMLKRRTCLSVTKTEVGATSVQVARMKRDRPSDGSVWRRLIIAFRCSLPWLANLFCLSCVFRYLLTKTKSKKIYKKGKTQRSTIIIALPNVFGIQKDKCAVGQTSNRLLLY